MFEKVPRTVTDAEDYLHRQLFDMENPGKNDEGITERSHLIDPRPTE